MNLQRRLFLILSMVLVAGSMLANHQTSDPNAVYGTITGWNPATQQLTLLDGAIVVDVSRAHIVDKQTGFPGTAIATGLQAKIILRPGPYEGGILPAALVELQSRTPASMAGSVTSIDTANNRFVAAGITIHVDENTKWRGGVNVRSIGELQVRHTVTAELIRVEDRLLATNILVVGFIPPSNHSTFGKVISVDGDTWVVRDMAGAVTVFKTTPRTIFNSQGPVEAEARVGEFVRVTSFPDDDGVEIALVITVSAPPSPQRGFGMFGTLLEVNEEAGFLAIAGVPGGDREEFAITEETGFYLGAKVGDFVEVRADLPLVDGRPTALQVIKTTNTTRMGIQGTVRSINNGTWMVDGWIVLVTPQTILINNPRVGDVVRGVGESERGSRTIRAISIERH